MSASPDDTSRKRIYGRGEPTTDALDTYDDADVSLQDLTNVITLHTSAQARHQDDTLVGGQRRVAELEGHVFQLQQRITYLTDQLAATNRDLDGYEALKRTHDDDLLYMAKLKAENDSLVGSREKYVKEAHHYRDEAERLQRQNDHLRRQNNHDHIQQQNDDLQRQNDVLQRQNGHMSRLLHERAAIIASHNRDLEDLRRQVDEFNVTYQGEKTPQLKRRRFTMMPSIAKECRNCGAVSGDVATLKIPCSFHASPGKPYKVAIKLSGSVSPPEGSSERQFFWPCCRKWAATEPRGCRSLREHDFGDQQ